MTQNSSLSEESGNESVLLTGLAILILFIVFVFMAWITSDHKEPGQDPDYTGIAIKHISETMPDCEVTVANITDETSLSVTVNIWAKCPGNQIEMQMPVQIDKSTLECSSAFSDEGIRKIFQGGG